MTQSRRIGISTNLGRLASVLARRFGLNAVSDETKRQLVCRSRDAQAQTNAWERRIIELSDGRLLSEIIETLYIDELKAGAWAADIGLWKNLFDRSVIETVHTLASKGYLSLVSDEGT